jgi:hypothetical protein
MQHAPQCLVQCGTKRARCRAEVGAFIVIVTLESTLMKFHHIHMHHVRQRVILELAAEEGISLTEKLTTEVMQAKTYHEKRSLFHNLE